MMIRNFKPFLFVAISWVLMEHATLAARPIPQTCGEHGTAVEFADSLADAAKRATQEEKLVFVLHVSGHFEKPKFT